MKKNTIVFVIMFLVACLVPMSLWANPFINEIHYDNIDTDTGEAIEIAGPAGTDLANYYLLLYRQEGTLYTTTPLTGVIPDQQNGFGTLFFTYPSNGIQNGPADGLALVAYTSPPEDTVIQLLSYEGTFTAVDGAASGLTSTDIGVSENSSTPVGYSLQLGGQILGVGTSYEDFTWSSPAPASFGLVNVGQTPIPPSLLLLGSGLLGIGAMGWRRKRKS